MKQRNKFLSVLAIALSAAVALPAVGQEQDPSAPPPATAPAPAPSNGGWRKFGSPAPADAQNVPPADPAQAPPPGYNGAGAPPPGYNGQGAPPPGYNGAGAPPPGYNGGPVPAYSGDPRQQAQQPPPIPSQITIPPGTWVTVRVNQPLSSDRNQPGDAFTASVVQPIVVNGIVIARRSQTIGGRVAEAQKAGRVSGTSRLGLELTELTLVDGQQLPVKTQLVERRGDTSVGRDATAIGVTTGAGAAIGAGAAVGFGAAVGAGAGLVASTIGVMVTRGRPTVVFPETVLTFRVEAPVSFSTDRSYDAFRPVTQQDYGQTAMYRGGPQGRPPSMYGPGYGRGPAPAPYPYYYAGPAYPYPYWGGYWGPSVYFYGGPRFYRRW